MKRRTALLIGIALLVVFLLVRGGCDTGERVPGRPARGDAGSIEMEEPIPPGGTASSGAFASRKAARRSLRAHGQVGDLAPLVEIRVTHGGDPVAGAEIRLGPAPPRAWIRSKAWPGRVHLVPPMLIPEGKPIGITDASGVFRGKVKHGHYTVHVRTDDLSNAHLGRPTLTTGWRSPEIVTVPVEKSLMIRGRCVDEAGLPLPDYWIQAYRMDLGVERPLAPVVTDEHGSFAVGPVNDGPHRVRALFPRGMESEERLLLPGEPVSVIREDAERTGVYPVRDFVEFRLRPVPVTLVWLHAESPARGLCLKALAYREGRGSLERVDPFWLPVAPEVWQEAYFPVARRDLSDYLWVQVSGFAPAIVRTPGGEAVDVHLSKGRRASGSVVDFVAKDQLHVHAFVEPDCTVLIQGIHLPETGDFNVAGLPETALRLELMREGKAVAMATAAAGTGDLVNLVLRP